jgi:hypothetical protein
VHLQFSKVKFLTSSAQQVVDAIKDSSVCSLDATATMIKPNTVVRARPQLSLLHACMRVCARSVHARHAARAPDSTAGAGGDCRASSITR